jgi:hypothetical protein
MSDQSSSKGTLTTVLVFAALIGGWYLLTGGHVSSQAAQAAQRSVSQSISAPVPTLSTNAVPAAPGGDPGRYSIVGSPTLSVSRINAILAAYGSPASGQGQALYDLGVKYGIDPTKALAFFLHESGMGKVGEATYTHSLGNMRCIDGYSCVQTSDGGYAYFDSWAQGFAAWYAMMRNLYVDAWHLTTFDAIIPHYAPEADHNDEKAYIDGLKHAVDVWLQGGVLV